MNDGKCDAAGRFWAGTCPTGPGAPPGALFVLDTDGRVSRALDDIGVSNGLGWSPDGTVMYYTDSATRTIDRVEFDLDRGLLGAREPLVHLPDGIPDGLAVDEEGYLWVAVFRGGQIRRYSPSGEQCADVRIPTANPTSCAFGGADYRSLYVTSARSESGVSIEPALPSPAGALFRVNPGVRGLPMHRYGVAA
jgi:sugar lactone lactonase YvrE